METPGISFPDRMAKDSHGHAEARREVGAYQLPAQSLSGLPGIAGGVCSSPFLQMRSQAGWSEPAYSVCFTL